jgi:enolase
MLIKEVKGRTIKDSRGEETIEIELETHLGKFRASAPYGKSKGKNEKPAYSARGLPWSLRLIGFFSEKVRGKNFQVKEFSDLDNFERLIKSFENSYESLGANVTIALEIAFLKAAAREHEKEVWEFIKGDRRIKIPGIMPVGNCIGGGMHYGNLKEKRPDFQEFLLIPKEDRFLHAVQKNIHAYEYTKKIIKKRDRKLFIGVNDEHALKTESNNEEALSILAETAEKFGLRIGLDVAASSFWKRGYYDYKNREVMRNNLEQQDYIIHLIKRFNLFYIEDPMHEEDFEGFASILKKVKDCLIVGDDLTVTNLERIKRAVEKRSINAVIIKPNQNGYLMEVAEIMKYCREKEIKTIFSHRSGETMDPVLGDLAIGFQADFIKTGILGKERLVKLKRVMDIEIS